MTTRIGAASEALTRYAAFRHPFPNLRRRDYFVRRVRSGGVGDGWLVPRRWPSPATITAHDQAGLLAALDPD